ncbi:Dam family site-specific DNA-(adenine-N6)-methyltransferase [Spiroplasma cantharicola]|uniref:Site-specific DNA-methyltransferase (adenine-specific) n=1 Tax=Spiroplasma cantharicola TaxID=362837 RepID=A0A0M3SJF7_9MOLU|nr:Dam family site-specific DNA-(adenine-N6)-methyltransferase [Spiroplasma cantharicola]ALD66654.1 adenine-specific DNA-methyltransferase [Spiroplasma cantharicola]
MIVKNTKRSPLFYVGDKYKVIDQIKILIPEKIDVWVEPFLGGGSSAMNITANSFILNDFDKNVINIHKYLFKNSGKKIEFFRRIKKDIEKFGLSSSFFDINMPTKILKDEFPKTYYSVLNKKSYIKLKEKFNLNKKIDLLYLLLVYGFNHMIRFNSSSQFNLPVGNVDFNNTTARALNWYFDWVNENKTQIEFYCMDYKNFLEESILSKYKSEEVFIFLDPPYLISKSEYNKFWDEGKEKELYEFLDLLNSKGYKFGITNLSIHKGKQNIFFEKWRSKYISKILKSNFISSHNNSIKNSEEIFVTNYEKY